MLLRHWAVQTNTTLWKSAFLFRRGLMHDLRRLEKSLQASIAQPAQPLSKLKEVTWTNWNSKHFSMSFRLNSMTNSEVWNVGVELLRKFFTSKFAPLLIIHIPAYSISRCLPMDDGGAGSGMEEEVLVKSLQVFNQLSLTVLSCQDLILN